MVSLFPPLVNIYFQGRFGVLTPSPDLCAVCFYPPWFVGLGFFNRSVARSLTAVLSDIKNLAGKLHIHGVGNFLCHFWFSDFCTCFAIFKYSSQGLNG